MVTKEALKDALLTNPKYDSGWIDNAVELICDFEYSEGCCEEYTGEQLSILLQANKQYHDDDKFQIMINNPDLNTTQMTLLITAKSKGINTENLKIFADPNIPFSISNYALQAIIDGLDITNIIDITEYTADQIYEIYAGFKTGVDYTKYISPIIPAEHMGLIRHALEIGLDVEFDPDEGYTISYKLDKEMF